jgi:hypothetical protein
MAVRRFFEKFADAPLHFHPGTPGLWPQPQPEARTEPSALTRVVKLRRVASCRSIRRSASGPGTLGHGRRRQPNA